MPDDKAFDRYGRILGSTGLTPIVDKLNAGFTTRQIYDSIKTNNPNASDEEIMSVVNNAENARNTYTELQKTFTPFKGFTLADIMASGSITKIDKATMADNPALFGTHPNGQRYRYGVTVTYPELGISRDIFLDFTRQQTAESIVEAALREANRRAKEIDTDYLPKGNEREIVAFDEIFMGEYRY